jgi:hypothetical protein
MISMKVRSLLPYCASLAAGLAGCSDTAPGAAVDDTNDTAPGVMDPAGMSGVSTAGTGSTDPTGTSGEAAPSAPVVEGAPAVHGLGAPVSAGQDPMAGSAETNGEVDENLPPSRPRGTIPSQAYPDDLIVTCWGGRRARARLARSPVALSPRGLQPLPGCCWGWYSPLGGRRKRPGLPDEAA